MTGSLNSRATPEPSPIPTLPRHAAPGTAPEWSRLSAQQREILQPLEREWSGMEPERRERWVAIAQIPYLAWVSTATVLQTAITFSNL